MRSNPRFRRSLASKLRGVLSEAEACDFVTEPLQTSATYEPRKLHVRGRGGRNPLSHYTGTYERQKLARERVSSFEEYGLLRSVNLPDGRWIRNEGTRLAKRGFMNY